jgi:cob(I)alamin adenosyltransferase
MPTFYTRTGDDGSSSLLGKDRLPKHHPRFEALGSLDEATAALGLARASCQNKRTKLILLEVQRDLYTIMTEIAATPDNEQHFQKLDLSRVQWLELQIDNLATKIIPPSEFLLPGDSIPSATLSLARTIVRRSERWAAKLVDCGEVKNPVIQKYLNRLSSLCFTLELFESSSHGRNITLAKK